MNYKVPFVDYPRHYHILKKEIDAAIRETLSKGDLILRHHLQQFESNIADFLGVDHAIGVNSGTDALYLSLLAAGVGAEDEVITVAHTFVATVAVIVHCGATPVLVDVGEDFNMSVDKIEEAINPRTKAIIPIYLNGRLCNMEKLMNVASKYNLIVIEDAAQALGATFDGKKAGAIGLTGCFSFYPAKILGAAGDGGLVVTSNSEIAEKIRLLRDHGQQRTTGDILYFGFNSRLDNLQAAILNVKLKYLPQWIERRRELANLYHQGLSDISDLRLPPPPDSQGRYFDIFANYVVRSQQRDRLVEHLRGASIEVLISWPIPMHKQPALGLGHFYLPETERISQEVISLPLYPELSNDKVEYVIESVHRFYKGRKV